MRRCKECRARSSMVSAMNAMPGRSGICCSCQAAQRRHPGADLPDGAEPVWHGFGRDGGQRGIRSEGVEQDPSASHLHRCDGRQGLSPVARRRLPKAPSCSSRGRDPLYGIEGCVTVSYVVYHPDTHTPMGVMVCCVGPVLYPSPQRICRRQRGQHLCGGGERHGRGHRPVAVGAAIFCASGRACWSGCSPNIRAASPWRWRGAPFRSAWAESRLPSAHRQFDLPGSHLGESLPDRQDQSGHYGAGDPCGHRGGLYHHRQRHHSGEPVDPGDQRVQGDSTAVYQAESHDEDQMLPKLTAWWSTKALIDQVYGAASPASWN